MSIPRIRHTRSAPCPICHGYESMERGADERCYGYTYTTGSGREYCICTREEYANGAEYQERSGGYLHVHDPAIGTCRPWLPTAPTPMRIPLAAPTPRTRDADAHKGYSRNDKGAFVAEILYPYRDEGGAVLYEVVRQEYERGKEIRQRKPDGDGWAWNLDGVRRVLYRLPDLLAADPRALVYLVEGEKHVERLYDSGLIATTNPQGGNQWRAEYAEHLRGRQVLVLPDNDETGRKWQRDVTASLAGVAASVRVLDLPGLPHKGDVLDWLDAGGSAERLAGLAEAAPPLASPDWTPRIVNLADVQPEQVRWLWPGYLPLGKVTIIDGDPGLGKSTLTLAIAACVSSGSTLPDGSHPDLDGAAGVVILSAEDGLADTIRPRLDAVGADVSRIVALECLERGEQERAITLADVGAIEEAVIATDARLVVVDPLMAYLGPKTDSHRDQDMRGILTPLKWLAEAHGVTIVVVRHLGKGGSANVLYRGQASIGIIGAARHALMVGRDPEDPEGPRRILAVSKSNLAMFPPAMAYHMEQAENGVARIVWEGTTHHSAAAITASVQPEAEGERSALDEAKDVLRTILAGGSLPAAEVQAQARTAGVAERTLDRAKTALRVKAHREGFGKEGVWYWTLPGEERGSETHRTPNSPIERQQNSMALYGHVGVLSTRDPAVQRVHERIAEHRARFSMLPPEIFQGVIGNLLASDGFSRDAIDRALAEAGESVAQSAD